MLKIVIDARESGTSSGRYIDKLIENLHKLELDYDITVLTKTPRIKFLKGLAPTFNILESNYKEFTFAEQVGFLKQLNSLKADLVHFPMPQQPILYRGKSVTTFHDLTTAHSRNPAKNWLVFAIKQQVYKWLVKRVAKKSNKLIAISNFTKRDVSQFANVPTSKIKVTYEAADKIKVSPQPLAQLQNKRFIMYVGRPQPHKNLKRLIEASETLQQTNPGLKLALVGKQDKLYEELEKWVQKKRLKNILFPGFVDEATLRWLYENASAYVFPSLSEGFGLPGLEAMVYGTPVVSSNATCLPEVYGHAAYYFNPLDASDMAAKISRVLSDDKLRTNLIAAGTAQVKKYSWLRMAQQTHEAYNQALSPS